jgi:hypothetical protein
MKSKIRRIFRLSKASSAVTPGESRRRPSLESKRSYQHESRVAVPPSCFERHATTKLLSPTCSGHHRDGTLPWTTSTHVGPAAMLHKELYVKRIGHIRELSRT